MAVDSRMRAANDHGLTGLAENGMGWPQRPEAWDGHTALEHPISRPSFSRTTFRQE
jgi:hypothetical protein